MSRTGTWSLCTSTILNRAGGGVSLTRTGLRLVGQGRTGQWLRGRPAPALWSAGTDTSYSRS